jgi:hypothetical protein
VADTQWPPPPDTPVPPVLGPNQIVDRARAEAARLGAFPGWAPAFIGASPVMPLLVERLDHAGWHYYLVSFTMGRGVTGRLRMNAHTGTYEEAMGVNRSGDELPPLLTTDALRQRIARRPWEWLGGAKKGRTAAARSVLDPVIVFEPFPVWRPCLQSLTAFLPFYHVVINRRRRFLRLDGRVFDQLTFGAGH